LQLEAPALDVFKIDGLAVLVFLLAGVYILLSRRQRQPWVFGLYAILMCVVPVSTGVLIAATRYVVVVFPVFLLLGEKLERGRWSDALVALLFTLQVL
jgi:hypothetical protein